MDALFFALKLIAWVLALSVLGCSIYRIWHRMGLGGLVAWFALGLGLLIAVVLWLVAYPFFGRSHSKSANGSHP